MAGNSERIIGELVARVEMLAKAIEENASDSREGRRKVYQSMEEQRMDISHIKRDVDGLTGRLDIIEPKLSLLDKWRERGIGAWMLIAFMFSSIGAALMYFARPIMTKLGL